LKKERGRTPPPSENPSYACYPTRSRLLCYGQSLVRVTGHLPLSILGWETCRQLRCVRWRLILALGVCKSTVLCDRGCDDVVR